MEKPRYHIFICCNSRITGEAKGICQKKDAAMLVQYLDEEIQSRLQGLKM